MRYADYPPPHDWVYGTYPSLDTIIVTPELQRWVADVVLLWVDQGLKPPSELIQLREGKALRRHAFWVMLNEVLPPWRPGQG